MKTEWITCDDKICISYFGQLRAMGEGQVPFSTAMWNPKWYTGLKLPELAPHDTTCTGCSEKDPTKCGFLRGYYEQLQKIDFERLINKLVIMSGNAQAILLVYETPSNPCSERGPLIRWFREHGVELREWRTKKDRPEQ